MAKGPGVLLTYALPDGAPTPRSRWRRRSHGPGELADGERLYHKWCARCHGAGAVSSSSLPDLRQSLGRLGPNFKKIARDGLPGTGMPAMGAYVSPEELELIRSYLASRS